LISSYPTQPKEMGPKFLAKLPNPEDEAAHYVQKMFPFEYTSGDKKLLARARYWPADHCWVIVAQPEEEVLKPAVDLEKDIREAWTAALDKVSANSNTFIAKRSDVAGQEQRKLV